MLPFLRLYFHLDLNHSFPRKIPVLVSAPTSTKVPDWSQGSELLPWSPRRAYSFIERGFLTTKLVDIINFVLSSISRLCAVLLFNWILLTPDWQS